nr:hypothetical protein [Frankia sp. Cas3]
MRSSPVSSATSPLSRGSPAASTARDHTPAGSAVDRFTPLPRDHGHLAALDGSYGYLRQFTPQVLDAVRFAAGTAAAELLAAVEILRELNATSARKGPDDAPTGFVPARWRSGPAPAAAHATPGHEGRAAPGTGAVVRASSVSMNPQHHQVLADLGESWSAISTRLSADATETPGGQGVPY